MNSNKPILPKFPAKKLSRSADIRLRYKLHALALEQKLTNLSALSMLPKAAAMGIVFLVLVASGSGIYAYSSTSVTAGTTLYPIKIALEKIEEQINTSENHTGEVHMKFVERRLDEAEHIIQDQYKNPKEGDQNLTKTLEEIHTEIIDTTAHSDEAVPEDISRQYITRLKHLSEEAQQKKRDDSVIKSLSETTELIEKKGDEEKNENKDDVELKEKIDYSEHNDEPDTHTEKIMRDATPEETRKDEIKHVSH